MSVSPKDRDILRVDDKGGLYLPRSVLARADLGPKMRVEVTLDGKRLVLTKLEGADNPLDGPLGRKLDHDLFGKVAKQQEEQMDKVRRLFDEGIADADADPEPPAHPFRWD